MSCAKSGPPDLDDALADAEARLHQFLDDAGPRR